jgi:hypothetical protein
MFHTQIFATQIPFSLNQPYAVHNRQGLVKQGEISKKSKISIYLWMHVCLYVHVYACADLL